MVVFVIVHLRVVRTFRDTERPAFPRLVFNYFAKGKCFRIRSGERSNGDDGNGKRREKMITNKGEKRGRTRKEENGKESTRTRREKIVRTVANPRDKETV